MKGKVKVLSLLCAAAMTLAVFAGCNNGSGTSSTATAEKIDTSKEVNLVWYQWGPEPKKAASVMEKLNELSKKDINTTVTIKWTEGSDEKVKSIMAAGGEYDIAFTCSWFANYITSAQKGYLADITDTLKKTPTLYNSMPETVWNGARVNGKIYAVPVYKDTAAQQYWLGNKQLVESADAMTEFKATGLRFSTVTPLLAKVKTYCDKNGYPNGTKSVMQLTKSGLHGTGGGYDDILGSIKVGTTLGDSKVISYFDNADYVSDYKTLKEWYDKGYSNKDCTTVEKEADYINVDLNQGYEGAEISDWGRAAGKPYDCIINKRGGPWLTSAYILGACNGISVNSKNKERALLYLEYQNTNAAYRNMLAYGIEGDTYKSNDDGTVTYLNNDYMPGIWAQAALTLLKPVSPAPKDMYEKLDKANRSAEASELLGFNLDISNIETKVAAVEAIQTKYINQLMCGTVADVDATIKKMVDEMNAAGYQEIIKEAQKQVDAFLANK